MSQKIEKKEKLSNEKKDTIIKESNVNDKKILSLEKKVKELSAKLNKAEIDKFIVKIQNKWSAFDIEDRDIEFYNGVSYTLENLPQKIEKLSESATKVATTENSIRKGKYIDKDAQKRLNKGGQLP